MLKIKLVLFSMAIVQVPSQNLSRLAVTHLKFFTKINIFRQCLGLNVFVPLPEAIGGSSQNQEILQDTSEAEHRRQKHLYHPVLSIH